MSVSSLSYISKTQKGLVGWGKEGKWGKWEKREKLFASDFHPATTAITNVVAGSLARTGLSLGDSPLSAASSCGYILILVSHRGCGVLCGRRKMKYPFDMYYLFG